MNETPRNPAQPRLREWIEAVIQRVAELPDRTSPDDWPEAMLVTADELAMILLAAPDPLGEAKIQQTEEHSSTFIVTTAEAHPTTMASGACFANAWQPNSSGRSVDLAAPCGSSSDSSPNPSVPNGEDSGQLQSPAPAGPSRLRLEWQPIGTSPKKGIRMLVWVPAEEGAYEAGRVGNAIFVPRLDRWLDVEEVSHWRPLPGSPVGPAPACEPRLQDQEKKDDVSRLLGLGFFGLGQHA